MTARDGIGNRMHVCLGDEQDAEHYCTCDIGRPHSAAEHRASMAKSTYKPRHAKETVR